MHQETSDKIVCDCVEVCKSVFSVRMCLSTHVCTLVWEYEWACLCVQYLGACVKPPVLAICVRVDSVVIDCRRPVVRVAVVTRRLRWLHWVKSSSSGCAGDLGESGSSLCSVALRFVPSLNKLLRLPIKLPLCLYSVFVKSQTEGLNLKISMATQLIKQELFAIFFFFLPDSETASLQKENL